MTVATRYAKWIDRHQASIMGSIRDWLARGSQRREFGLLAADDADRILGENGISRSDFIRIVNAPLASDDLLSPTMRSLGLEADEVRAREPAVMRDLERVCAMCSDRRRCNDQLREGRAAVSYRDYCPNASTFGSLMADRQD